MEGRKEEENGVRRSEAKEERRGERRGREGKEDPMNLGWIRAWTKALEMQHNCMIQY